MGDLISRSALIEMINNDIDMTVRFMNKITNPLEMATRNYIALSSQLNTLKSIRTIIDEQPTAYDVEKVVAELEDKSQYCIPINGQAFTGIKTEYAIDIVKAGGVDD